MVLLWWVAQLIAVDDVSTVKISMIERRSMNEKRIRCRFVIRFGGCFGIEKVQTAAHHRSTAQTFFCRLDAFGGRGVVNGAVG